MTSLTRNLAFLLTLSMLLATGCTPQAKRARALKTADGYFAAGAYEKAEVEYLNVLNLDALNPHAIGRLGLIYCDQGRFGKAISYLNKGHELLPEDPDLMVKLGELDLATGNMKGAMEKANFVLARRPQDPEAPMMLASSITKPEDVGRVRQELKSLPAPAPDSAPVVTALAMIDLRTGFIREGEAGFRKAIALDPKYAAAYSALATLHLAKKDVADAEKEFKQAADLSPWRSQRRMQYVQFKIRTGDIAAAKALLDEIMKQVPDFIPAWTTRAEVAFAEHKNDECLDLAAKALARDPTSFDAIMLHARAAVAKGENDVAINEMVRATANFPRVAVLHLELGRAYIANGDISKAIDSLKLAINLSPGNPDATMLLAGLNIRKGDLSGGVAMLKKVVEQHPEMVQARLMLADAYRSQSNFDEALAIYTAIEKALPDNAQIPLMRGLVLVQLKKMAEAREAFVRARGLAPDSPAALEQMVNLDLLDKKYDAARKLVTAEAEGRPKLAGYAQLLLAKTYLAQNDLVQAEAALKKAIELMPDAPTPYFLLAGLYSATNQLPKALANLEQAVAHNPKDPTALMLIGVIQEKQKNFAAAREAYEKLLVNNPQSFGALNNLAYLLSEHFNDLDRAHQLAQKARELQPQEGHTADTLGWILYKKHQYAWALSVLEDAADKLPADPEVQYHLGMTHYMLGEEAPALAALRQATQPGADFAGLDEARKSLDLLNLETAKVGPESRDRLEKIIAERPGDPVALARLAMIFERSGDRAQAIATLEKTLVINPNNVAAMVSLAQLQAANKANGKALELAKSARKLAPSDPAVARALGRLAYQAGDYAWSASLLQEAARNLPPSADLWFDLALADYNVGQVDDAQAALKRALQPGEMFLGADRAKKFLDLIGLAANPAEAVKQSAVVEQALRDNPDDLPALMASAAISEARLDPVGARKIYEKILGRFADFSPAKLRIAIIAAAQPDPDQKALAWGQEARLANPANPPLARALAILSYRNKEYGRAVTLLKEALAASDKEAELWFLLGMSQQQLNQPAEAKPALQRALDLGLTGESAAAARKILAGTK